MLRSFEVLQSFELAVRPNNAFHRKRRGAMPDWGL